MSLKKFCILLGVMLLTLASFSCVDIPGGVDSSTFTFVSQVRYVNLTRGADTVALFLKQTFDSTLTGKPTRTYPVTFTFNTKIDSIFNRDRDTLIVEHDSVATIYGSGSVSDTTTQTFRKIKVSIVKKDIVIHRDSLITKTTICSGTCTTKNDTVKSADTLYSAHIIKTTTTLCDTATGVCTTKIKYAGKVDTLLARDTTTTRDTTVATRYTVHAGDTSIVKVKTSYYKRYLVDSDSTLDVVLDGTTIASLQFGQSTPYLNNNAGSRKMYLKTTAPRVDTLLTIQRDSTFTTRYDTLLSAVPQGKSEQDTTITKKTYGQNIVASGQSDYIIADSTLPTLLLNTSIRSSVFFIRDTVASYYDIKNSGRARYGFVRFYINAESYTFAGPPSADSVQIRYINASMLKGAKHIEFNGTYVYRKAGHPDTTLTLTQCPKGYTVCPLDTINFMSTVGYLSYPAGFDTARFSLVKPQSPIVDSVLFTTANGGHRYTIMMVDVDTTFSVTRLADD